MVSGEENLTERFNVNNKEQNKKRFLEANSNIFKNKQSGLNKAKGAKFHNQELDFNLTPQKEEFDERQFSQPEITLPQKRLFSTEAPE